MDDLAQTLEGVHFLTCLPPFQKPPVSHSLCSERLPFPPVFPQSPLPLPPGQESHQGEGLPRAECLSLEHTRHPSLKLPYALCSSCSSSHPLSPLAAQPQVEAPTKETASLILSLESSGLSHLVTPR